MIQGVQQLSRADHSLILNGVCCTCTKTCWCDAVQLVTAAITPSEADAQATQDCYVSDHRCNDPTKARHGWKYNCMAGKHSAFWSALPCQTSVCKHRLLECSKHLVTCGLLRASRLPCQHSSVALLVGVSKGICSIPRASGLGTRCDRCLHTLA